jgi:K+-sensing histidine kinase KdpD
MKFKNARLWVQHTPLVAARDTFLILLAAFLLRYGLHEVIQPYAVFHFFIVACIIVAVRYGYKMAFMCLIASHFLGTYFFVKPYGELGIITTSDLIQAFNFFFVTAISILVIEKLQRVIYAQKLLIKVMQDRQRSMMYRKNELLNKLRLAERQR